MKMKKVLSALLAAAMTFSMTATAFAAEPTNEETDRIERAAVEAVFASKPAPVNAETTLTPDEEHELFLEILPQIQRLRMEQQQAEENGEDTTAISNQIEELENTLDSMNSIIRLSNDQIATLGVKPTVPSGNSYVECWGSKDRIGTYNGKQYDVFEIYAAGTRYGGFANNLGYQEEGITLITDSKWQSNTFGKSFYSASKFAVGAFSIPFAVVDYLALSKMPDFFDDGSTQQLLLGYNALQTYCFSYASEKGVGWYDHVVTAEQVDYNETLTAISVPSAGQAARTSKDRHTIIKTDNYANANYAAQVLARGLGRQEYHVGNIKYTVDGKAKYTVYFNSFGELYSIPGL